MIGLRVPGAANALFELFAVILITNYLVPTKFPGSITSQPMIHICLGACHMLIPPFKFSYGDLTIS